MKFIYLIGFTILFFSSLVTAENKKLPIVNVLTWWNYLSYPWVKEEIRNQCGAQLSYDEVFSNSEFLRRWRNSNEIYDIAIFADTLYAAIENSVKREIFVLQPHVSNYHPQIKQQYYSRDFAKNVVYFYQSTTGFLWNSDNVTLDANDSVEELFGKASTNIVIMIDDPTEVFYLISNLKELDKPKTAQELTFEDFKRLTQSTKVHIVNSFIPAYANSDFAFSYLWSGEAILNVQFLPDNYQFLIHNSLSNISSDMLAILNTNPHVVCTAKLLSSEPFLTRLQEETFYFSPYANMNEITNPTYQKIYQEYIENLAKLQWIQPFDQKSFIKKNNSWKTILSELQIQRNQ